MINDKELLFIVDENNQPLNPQLRSFAHKNGLWHRTSGVWVINRKKQILCHKRSLKKDIRPGAWEAFFGGHLAPKEDYRHNAVSEMKEELGIEVNENNLIAYKALKSDKPTHKEFQHIFALILDEKQKLQFEKAEVEQLSWKDIKEVGNILVNKKDDSWVQKPWDKEVLSWLASL